MNRILLIRLSALGDVVMASGLIPALRRVYPHAHLAWLVEPPAAPLLRHNRKLDEVIVWPRGEWQALWKARRYVEVWRRARAFRQELRSRRFDLAIDAQGLLKSAVWARMSGAPRRISLIGHESSHLLATERVVPPPDPTKPIGNEYRFLAKHLGAPGEAFQLDLALGDAAHASAMATLAAAGVGPRWAALCPFTTRPQKHWFEDRWAALGLKLLAAGITPVLLGGPTDVEPARRIANAATGMVNLAGRLKLDETAAAIAMCRVLVGVDTGLTHMGTALKVPTVALFGSTRPYLDPRTPTTTVMYEALDCSPCHRRPTCNGAFHCMRRHEVDAVFATAMRLMEAHA